MSKSDKLHKLADFLESVPDELFDMDFWGKTTRCGTVYCAVGWATQIPEFAEEGLILWRRGYAVRENPMFPDGFSILFKGFDDFRATMEFFELTSTETDYLFYSGSYKKPVTKQDVIDRIREFACTGKTEE